MDVVKRREAFKKKLRNLIEKPKNKNNLLEKKEKENKVYRTLTSKSKKTSIVLKQNKNVLPSKKQQTIALTEEVKRTDEEIKILKILIPYISKRKEYLKDLQNHMNKLLERLKTCIEPLELSKIMVELIDVKQELDILSMDYELIRKNTQFDGFERYHIPNLDDKINQYKGKNHEEVISRFAKDCSKLASSLEKQTEELEKWAHIEQKIIHKKKQFEKREESFQKEKEVKKEKEKTLTTFHYQLMEIENHRYYSNQTLLQQERSFNRDTYSLIEDFLKKTTITSFVLALLSSGLNPITLLTSIALLKGPFKTDKEELKRNQQQKLLKLYEEYDNNMSFEIEALQTLGTGIVKQEEDVKKMKENFCVNYKEEIKRIPEFNEFFHLLETLELNLYQKRMEQQKQLEAMKKEKENAKQKKKVLEKA